MRIYIIHIIIYKQRVLFKHVEACFFVFFFFKHILYCIIILILFNFNWMYTRVYVRVCGLVI